MRQHGFSRHSQRKPVLVDEGIGNLTCYKQNVTHSPRNDIAYTRIPLPSKSEAQNSTVNRLHQVVAEAKKIGGNSVQRQKTVALVAGRLIFYAAQSAKPKLN